MWTLILIAALAGGTPAASPEPLDADPFFFALSVADVERSADWYSRVFGFELARSVDLEQRGIRIRLLRREGAFLELTESGAARPLAELDPSLTRRHQLHGVFKIGFRVDSLDASLKKLERLQVPLRGKVVTESDGSMRSLQVVDPDGNVVQIFELLQ